MNDSFILYTSYYALIEGLTDEQLGQLTRAIFLYARDGETISLEPVVRMAFGFIVDDMKRNKAKYEEKVERWRANGRKGGAPKGNQNARKKQPVGCENNQEVKKTTQNNQEVKKTTQNNQEVKKTTLYDNEYDNEYVNDNVDDNDVSKETDIEPSKEGIESASVKTEAPGGGKGSKSQKIDYAAVKEYWNRKHDETKSAMPPITLMTENRKVMVKARVRQCKGDVKTLYRVIDIAMASDFMNGNNKHGWLGKFDWIFGNEQNFAKVLEGNFNNEPATSQQPQSAAVKAQDPAATARPSIPAEPCRLEEEPEQQASQGFADKILREGSSAAAGHRLEARKITNEGKISRSGTFSRFGR